VLQGIAEHDDGFICGRRKGWQHQRWSPAEPGKEAESLNPNSPLEWVSFAGSPSSLGHFGLAVTRSASVESC